MSVKLVIAVTDEDWFEALRQQQEEDLLGEVNFWAPSDTSFRALKPGELFLFKLRGPHNVIVGGGIFARAVSLPCSLAWEAFGKANGAGSAQEMRALIARYRRADAGDRSDFRIGCRILTQPFFFAEADWIPVPPSWSPNIVAFKTYDTGNAEGVGLWEAASERANWLGFPGIAGSQARFGEPRLISPRLGQAAFRAIVTDNYNRSCAITGERTLPALDAAHIRPFAVVGRHEERNGLLLRRDIHSLFDAGYVTVTPDLRFEVSRRIKDEFHNGRHYYALHGRSISAPEDPARRPDPDALAWHNEQSYRG